MVTLKYTLLTLLFLVTLNIFCQEEDDNECIVTTINYDFEEPITTGLYPLFLNQASMPGWSTTASDGQIELWPAPNFENIPSYSGNQFVELNANVVSGLYQEYDSPVGTVFNYSFAHRGRMGTDTCQLLAGPPGGPYTNVGPQVSTGNTAWSNNTGTYVVPPSQPITRFIFQSVNSVGGISVGNFLDNINFTANVGILTEGPLELFCGEEASIGSLGGGTWIEDSNNPSATIISDLNSNNITISGFSVAGEYIYEWDSIYCSSTITIIYDEGFIEPPLVEDIFYCQNSIANPIDIQPIEDHIINWFSDSLGLNPLNQVPIINTSVLGQTTYYVSQENINGCTSELVPIVVSINQVPYISTPTEITVCDDVSNDGISIFNLTLAGLEALDTQNPNDFNITYHLSLNDAEANADNISIPEAYENSESNSETIYIRIENNDNTSCYEITEVLLVVFPFESPNFSYNSNCYGAEVLSVETAGGLFSFSVAPIDDAYIDTDTGEITNGTAGESYSVEYVTNGNCSNSMVVVVELNSLPIVITPTPLEVCDDATSDGIAAMDLTLKNSEVTNSNGNYTVSYHLTQADADNNEMPLVIPYTNTVNGQIVYVRVQDINTGCYDTTTLMLVVEQAPAANTPTPLEYCDPDSDGFGEFDLESKNIEITGGDQSLIVSYHETRANAENNVIPLLSLYSNIVENMQTIFVRVESSSIATDCETIVELILIVNPTPQLGEVPTPLNICDDASADGFGQFNLTSKDSEVLQNLVNPASYNVSYYETEINAELGSNSISNPINYTNTTAFNQTIWIRVQDNTTGCYKLTTLELIVNAIPVITQPTPLELCDSNNSGDEIEIFMLEDASDEILNGQTGINLTYFETQEDVDNNMNPIISPYANIVNPQTIFIKATNSATGCVNTVSLLLRVIPIPSPTSPTDLEACDIDNDGFTIFDLETRILEIIGGELNTVVTYHETQSDADAGVNALPNLYTNIVRDVQTIYIRLTNTITSCYNSSKILTLRALESPEVPLSIDDYVICDSDSNGMSQFSLTTKNSEIIVEQTDVTLTYHITEADALTGNSPISNMGNYTNTSNPQTIYVRLVSNLNDCVDTGMFELQVELPPIAIQPTPLELCDDEIADEVTVFDLTEKDYEITGGEASWSVSYYETNLDAQAQENAVNAEAYTNTSVGDAVANPQTLFAVVTDTDTGCSDQVNLTIRVLPNPTPKEVLPDLILCDDINTGDMEEVFDLTTNEVLLINGESNVTPTYYETFEDAEDGVNAIISPTMYTNASMPQVIYVRVTNDNTDCFTIVNFTIIVNPLPEVVTLTDFIACELNNDGFYNFDLTLKDAEVLNGQNPDLFTVTYHASQQDADDLMNMLVSPYTNISNPQLIYVAITNVITGCSISTETFKLVLQEASEANSDMEAILFEICDDEMDNDNDPSNNRAEFNLTSITDATDLLPESIQAQVLDGQDPANYILTYYASEVDAELGVNSLPLLYENLVNPQVIWVRVDNDTLDGAAMDTSICYAVAPLTLQVNTQPVFDLEDSYTLCVDTNGSEVISTPILETGLSTPNYSFVWFLNGTEIEGAIEGNYIPSEDGTYSVTVTDVSTSLVVMCESSDSTEVIKSSPPLIVTALVTTDAFSEIHVIEVTVEGQGEYEYSLDEDSWQDEPIFIDVSLGVHSVTVRDKNGCGEGSDDATVRDYPKFFTPNEDGLNDTWNISAIDDQPNAKIYIFDRYGKLLKQLSPSGAGWNGTYNGSQMPTSDYWFVVEYNEPSTGVRKEFKAHFTLKR